MKTLNVTEFRKNIFDIVRNSEPVRIFVNGRIPKVVIDENDYEEMKSCFYALCKTLGTYEDSIVSDETKSKDIKSFAKRLFEKNYSLFKRLS